MSLECIECNLVKCIWTLPHYLVIILIIVGPIKPLLTFSCLFCFPRVPYYQGRLVLVKPFQPRQLQARPKCHFLVSLDQNSWKCLWVLVQRESEICLLKQERMHHVLYLLMKSMLLVVLVDEAVILEGMMRGKTLLINYWWKWMVGASQYWFDAFFVTIMLLRFP